MSLNDIFDPIVRCYFKNKFANSGGGSSGNTPNTDIIGVVYDMSKEYETLDIDGALLNRVSDLIPSAEDLENTIVLLPDTSDSIPFFAYGGFRMTVTKEPVDDEELHHIAILSYGEFALGLSIDEYASSILGVPPGFWFCINTTNPDETGKVYIIWQPK